MNLKPGHHSFQHDQSYRRAAESPELDHGQQAGLEPALLLDAQAGQRRGRLLLHQPRSRQAKIFGRSGSNSGHRAQLEELQHPGTVQHRRKFGKGRLQRNVFETRRPKIRRFFDRVGVGWNRVDILDLRTTEAAAGTFVSLPWFSGLTCNSQML